VYLALKNEDAGEGVWEGVGEEERKKLMEISQRELEARQIQSSSTLTFSCIFFIYPNRLDTDRVVWLDRSISKSSLFQILGFRTGIFGTGCHSQRRI